MSYGLTYTACGRLNSVSHCVHCSMMFPSASTTMRQCSHRASTPSSRKGGCDPRHSSIPLAGSWPDPPAPGGVAWLALRHGTPPTGNWTLGPTSEYCLTSGRLRFGSSPPPSRYTRFGLSAKMPRAPPYVQPSCPGSVLRSFGQPATTSYGPDTSCTPMASGTAENAVAVVAAAEPPNG